MKTLTTVACILAATTSLLMAQVPAQKSREMQSAPKKMAAMPMKTHHMSIEGEVVSVDTAANTITLKSKEGKTEILDISKVTVIRKADKTIQLAEVSAGNKIMASCKMDGTRKYAVSINVKSPVRQIHLKK